MNAQAQPLAIVPNLSSEAESCCNSLSTVNSNCDGSTASDDTSIESLINRRKFLLNCQIPGNDANQAPQCIIDDSICDLCLHFIGSSLNKQNYTYQNSRWKERTTSFDSKWYDRKVFHHYSSSRTLKNSAGAGCKLCYKIIEFSASIDDDLMVLGGELSLRRLNDQIPRDGFQFSICPLGQFLKGLNKGIDIQFEFVLAEDKRDCLKMPRDFGRSVGSTPSLDSRSDECFDRILQWYENCTSKHGRCLRSPLPLPRRLLNLFPNSHSLEQITLIESMNIPTASDRISYVALTYCWGEQQEFITTKENLATMLHGIYLEQLPAVVRDAIYVCKRCKIQYLWGKHLISSLQII